MCGRILARLRQGRNDIEEWSIWSVLSIWSVWFNGIDETNQTNLTNRLASPLFPRSIAW